jgi:hypothetical protein
MDKTQLIEINEHRQTFFGSVVTFIILSNDNETGLQLG